MDIQLFCLPTRLSHGLCTSRGMIVGFSPCVTMNRIAVVDVCLGEEATSGNGRTLITGASICRIERINLELMALSTPVLSY